MVLKGSLKRLPPSTVAAKLLVARLLWANSGNNVDAVAARRRLLVSGKVEDTLLGKYRSASIPAIERLIPTTSSVAYSPDGKSIDAKKYLGNMFVSLKHGGPVGSIQVVFDNVSNGLGSTFSALQIGKDKIYLFNSSTLMWNSHPADSVVGICLCDAPTSQQQSFLEMSKLISEVATNE